MVCCMWRKRIQEKRIVMCGLDAAGKTTILYGLKTGEVVTTIPTIGFNVETLECDNVRIVAWDIGGKDKIRPLWRHYFERTDGLVFVVDSNDRDRMGEVRDELWRLLNEPQLIRVPVLVLANKQDLPGALSGSAVADALGLMAIRSRPWFIQATCATARPGPGLYGRDPSGIRDGLSWLAAATKGEVPTPALKRGRVELPDEMKDILNEDVVREIKSYDYELADFEFDNEFLTQAAAAADGGYAVYPLAGAGAAAARRALEYAATRLAAPVAADAVPAADGVPTADAVPGRVAAAAAPRPPYDVLELREAERAQLRLENPLEVRAAVAALASRDENDQAVAALADVARSLAEAAATRLGKTADAVLETATLDAFRYGRGGRCHAHRDKCLTIVLSDGPGLEVKVKEGKWLPAPHGPDCVVAIDAGVEHRVVATNRVRVSIVLDARDAPPAGFWAWLSRRRL
mmetsp:Transcript_13202/g.40734  ORF Transcript_13202/g.40734 Transcript_13202/m.40734 type:complete len:461 (-) Transcript_13202:116-1498(-)